MKNFKLHRTAAIIGYIVLAVVLFSSCKKEYYKSTVEVCLKSHFIEEEYQTGGLSVQKSTMTANRTKTRIVEICDTSRIDTVVCCRYVFK